MLQRADVARLWGRVVPVLAALSWGLGVFAFLGARGEAPLLHALPGAALSSLQLFVINVAPQDVPPSLAGWLAAVLAPLATAGAAIYALGERAWQAWQAFWLRLRPADEVFLGGGWLAAGIAARRTRKPDAAARRAKLVALVPAGDAALVRAQPSFDADGFVRVGDALSVDALRSVRPHRAGTVWVLDGDDHRNLAVAQSLRTLLESSAPPAVPVRVLVELRDRSLLRAVDRLYEGLDASRASFDFFSLPRLAARTLLREHPLRPSAGRRSAHLLIVGADAFAAALAVHAAQHCIHDDSPEHCVRVTLLGRGAQALHQDLLQRFPTLDARATARDPLLDGLLPLARIASLECDEAALGHADWRALQQDQPFDLVCVTGANALATMTAASRAATLRELSPELGPGRQPVLACLHTPQPVALPPGVPVIVFDVFARCLRTDEAYPGARQDRRATMVHAVYAADPDAAFEATDAVVEAAAMRWAESRKEDYRWSDRLAADHIDLKLDLLASRPQDPTMRDWREALANDPERVAQALRVRLRTDSEARMRLARLEHRRFVVERLLEGWLPLPVALRGRGASELPAGQQKALLRLNHTLVPYDRLPEVDPEVDQRGKDLRIVDAMPEILRGEAMLG